ncbi:MAG TPA: hypothetical protein VJJ77_12425, partial [Dongiaceae bacterium]|nr:hypothetical protein [Dongiaceae bacterium]
MVALVCASVVATYDKSWLTRPVCALVPAGGPRPEKVCRIKSRVVAGFAALVAAALRRGRPPRPASSAAAGRAPLLGALLHVATSLLTEVGVPLRRRAIADRLVAAYDRLARDCGATASEFCAALAIPERTFRSWRVRPAAAPAPVVAPAPPPPRRRDRATGRFALEVTAPGIQLGSDTTCVRVLGVDLKLTATQDLGAREQRLWEAFALDEHETADLVERVVAEAAAGRQGLQHITDQGTPFLAEAAKAAYDALGLQHAPQKEGA